MDAVGVVKKAMLPQLLLDNVYGVVTKPQKKILMRNKMKIHDNVPLGAISYFEDNGFIEELTTDKRYYVEELIAKVREQKDELSTLAYENKAMAETLEELGYDVNSLIFKHREG